MYSAIQIFNVFLKVEDPDFIALIAIKSVFNFFFSPPTFTYFRKITYYLTRRHKIFEYFYSTRFSSKIIDKISNKLYFLKSNYHFLKSEIANICQCLPPDKA